MTAAAAAVCFLAGRWHLLLLLLLGCLVAQLLLHWHCCHRSHCVAVGH